MLPAPIVPAPEMVLSKSVNCSTARRDRNDIVGIVRQHDLAAAIDAGKWLIEGQRRRVASGVQLNGAEFEMVSGLISSSELLSVTASVPALLKVTTLRSF